MGRDHFGAYCGGLSVGINQGKRGQAMTIQEWCYECGGAIELGACAKCGEEREGER